MKVKIESENMKLDHEPLEKGAEVEVPASVGQIWIETKRASRVGGAAPKTESTVSKNKGKKGPQKTANKAASQESGDGTPEQGSSEETGQADAGAAGDAGKSDTGTSDTSQENS